MTKRFSPTRQVTSVPTQPDAQSGPARANTGERSTTADPAGAAPVGLPSANVGPSDLSPSVAASAISGAHANGEPGTSTGDGKISGTTASPGASASLGPGPSRAPDVRPSMSVGPRGERPQTVAGLSLEPPLKMVQERRLRSFTGAGYDKGRSRLWQIAWFVVLNVAFMKWWMPMRYRPAILRAFGADIGDRVRIRQNVRVLWPWKLSIGADCWIGEGAWLLNLEKITIEHDACLSQEVFLCTGSHRHADVAFEFDNAPIHIGAGAWIAARATVLRGTVVGPGVLVGSGSVVRPIPTQSHPRHGRSTRTDSGSGTR